MAASLQLSIKSNPSPVSYGKYKLVLEIMSSTGLPTELFVMRRKVTSTTPDAQYSYYRVAAQRDFAELPTSRVTNLNEYRVNKIELDLSSPGQVQQVVDGIRGSLDSLLFDVNEGTGASYTGTVDKIVELSGGV
jgi:hypothetical protein